MNKGKIIILIGIGILILVTGLVVAIHFAPVFTYCLLVMFILSFGFIMTEGMLTHAANEFENRFWSSMAFFFACACIYSPDSPLRLPFANALHLGLSIPIIFTFTYLVHIYDRHLRRMVLNKVPNIMKRIRSADFSNMQNRLNAQQKLNILREHLETIDHIWLSSTFQNIFLLPQVLQIEHNIITIFEEVPEEQLNFIITKVQLGRIFYKVKDHKIARRFNRTKLLELLAVTRQKELGVYARAMLLHALQVMKLSAHPLCEMYVKNIILSTKEDSLSDLKCITDSKGDIYSMHKLIFEDIHDKSIQQEILNYILLQARIQQGHNTIRSKKGKKRSRLAWKKIVSDVDDTLTCSGGSYPAGVDTSYPKKAVYPGVLAFYRELDLGVAGDEEWSESLQGNLVFLSARPHVYKDMSEHVTYDKFTLLQQTRGLYTSPSLLAGDLQTGSRFILKDDLEPLAENKFRKLTEYIALYPEYSCIFIGDNGQGDARMAEMILDSAQYKRNLNRIYIHEVIPLQRTHIKEPKLKTHHPKSPIVYFKSYVEAAIDAYKNDLIRLTGLRRVMMESLADYEYLSVDDWKRCELLDSSSNPTGEPSRRPNSTSRRRKVPSKLASYQLVLEPKCDTALRAINTALSIGNQVLISGGLPPTRLLKYKTRFKIGVCVKTPYGKGIIVRFRPSDGMYEVLMQWDATGQHKPVTGFFQFCSLQNLTPVPSTVPPVGQVPMLNSIAHNPLVNSGNRIASVGSRELSSRAGSTVTSTNLQSGSELNPSLSASKNMTPSRSIAGYVLNTLQTIPTALGFLPRSDSLTSTVSVNSSVGSILKSESKPTLSQQKNRSAMPDDLCHSPQRRNSFGSMASGSSGVGDGYSDSSRFPEATVIMAQQVTLALSPDVSPARLASYPTAVGFAVPSKNQGAVPMDLFNRPFPGIQANPSNNKHSVSSAIVEHWGLCWTPYGIGRPVDYRYKDDMVVVQIESTHTSALIMTVYVPRIRVVQLTLRPSSSHRLPSQQAQLMMRRQRGYSIDTPSQSQSLRSSRIEYSSEIHDTSTSHILDDSFSSGHSLSDPASRLATEMSLANYNSGATTSTSFYDDDEL